MFNIGTAPNARATENETREADIVVHLVCTASAYVRASGGLYDACLKMARREHGNDIDAVTVNMILVDNSNEETVLVLSENICSIAKEFSDLHDLAAVQSGELSAVMSTAMCASRIVGHYDTDPESASCNILLMVSENADTLKDLLEDVVSSAAKEDIQWEILSVCEFVADDTFSDGICILE